MSRHYGDIAFTEQVRGVQRANGSAQHYARRRSQAAPAAEPDPMTPEVQEFLTERDSFFVATVSQTGWPYVQFRGGPPGFVEVVDEHTFGWADFRGNLQYISTGNLATADRVAIIAMDYARRRRLKIFGHATVITAGTEPAMLRRLTRPDYPGVVERGVVVSVVAYDWNCPQHITPRYTLTELEPHLGDLRRRLLRLETENADLRENCGPPATRR